MCLLAISQCISALLVLCTQPQSRNSCVLLSAAFFSTQQFDAVLSGITFATPIFTPAVTLLLPNLLPSSLLPPASSGCKYTRLHIKFEPQPLPPAQKCTNINRLQALHLFGLFLLNLLYIDFFFIFSQLVNLWVFQLFFFFVLHLRACFPANGVTQSCRGSAVIGCWGGLRTDLIMHLHCCLEETPKLSLQLLWNGMNELLRHHSDCEGTR